MLALALAAIWPAVTPQIVAGKHLYRQKEDIDSSGD